MQLSKSFSCRIHAFDVSILYEAKNRCNRHGVNAPLSKSGVSILYEAKNLCNAALHSDVRILFQSSTRQKNRCNCACRRRRVTNDRVSILYEAKNLCNRLVASSARAAQHVSILYEAKNRCNCHAGVSRTFTLFTQNGFNPLRGKKPLQLALSPACFVAKAITCFNPLRGKKPLQRCALSSVSARCEVSILYEAKNRCNRCDGGLKTCHWRYSGFNPLRGKKTVATHRRISPPPSDGFNPLRGKKPLQLRCERAPLFQSSTRQKTVATLACL